MLGLRAIKTLNSMHMQYSSSVNANCMLNEYLFLNEWQDVLDPFSSSPAEYSDLLLDIADAYTDNGKHVLCRVGVVY